MNELQKAAIKQQLTEAYMRGYREGGQDALAAAITAFDSEAATYPGVADALRTMLTLSQGVLADD